MFDLFGDTRKYKILINAMWHLWIQISKTMKWIWIESTRIGFCFFFVTFLTPISLPPYGIIILEVFLIVLHILLMLGLTGWSSFVGVAVGGLVGARSCWPQRRIWVYSWVSLCRATSRIWPGHGTDQVSLSTSQELFPHLPSTDVYLLRDSWWRRSSPNDSQWLETPPKHIWCLQRCHRVFGLGPWC